MGTFSGIRNSIYFLSAISDLEKEFDGLDEECVGKFVSCGQAATGFMSVSQNLPLPPFLGQIGHVVKISIFQSAVKSTKLVEYICMKILPQLHAVTDLDAQTSILKILAEAAMYTSDVADPKTATMNVFQRLLVRKRKRCAIILKKLENVLSQDFMPIPPEDAADSMTDQPEFEFTKVECLLLTFHRYPQFDVAALGYF